MKEKLKAFFQNEKVKSFCKRVFNKKTLTAAVIVVVIAVALRITFSLVFEVKGVVSKVDGSKITVVNFLTTKTVDVGNFQTSTNGIQVGDRIVIIKNLSGDVMSVRDRNRRYINENAKAANHGKGNFKNNGGRNQLNRK